MEVRALETADPEWSAYLAGNRYDIFHVPAFVHAEDLFRGTKSRLVVVEDGDSALLVPLIFSPLSNDLQDASSPHGPAGPVFSDDTTERWRHAAVSALLDYLHGLDVVSLFLRAHPLSGLQEFSRVGTVVEHGPTFVIPLDRPLDEIKGGMRQNHRRNMRRAERDGHIPELDSNWDHLEEFHWIYDQTMERLGAGSAYRYTREHFERLRDTAGTSTSLWTLTMDGELAGAHLVTECNGTVQYFLGATHPDYHRKVPQVAIFDAVLRWAHERGNQNYVLGGGLQESLRHFKAGFTQVEQPEATARIVVHPEEYARLCAGWESENGPLTHRPDSFFPGYRTPVEPAG